MLLFWVAAATLSLAAAVLILHGAARSGKGPVESDPTLNLYRRQMGEIDEMVDRGLLDEAERRAARAEAGRRLLAAAEQPPQTPQSRPARPVVFGVAAATILAAGVVYFAIGAPGLPDQPYAARVAEWRRSDPRTLDPPRMVAVLKTILAERPGDVEGLRFLGQAQLAAGDPFGAEDSARRALAAAPQRAELWMLLGGALAAQADGALTAGARQAFEEALKREPGSPAVRYVVGRARIEAGAVEDGLVLWKGLLAELSPQASERATLAQDISAVERTGRLPDAAPAPSEADAQMQTAIRGMVENLAARLAANPEDPEGWVRLVRSYSVLGETTRRDEALATASERFKDKPEVLSALDEAAKAQ